MALNPQKSISASRNSGYRKINFFLVSFLGFLILGCSALVYVFIIKESFGSFTAADLIPTGKSFQDFFNKQTKIALYRSDLNDPILSRSRRLKIDIKAWEKFLEKSKIKYDIIDNGIIQQGNYFKYTLIILPNRISLTDQQALQLENFIGSGGSLFVSGEIGYRLKDQIVPGRSFLSEIFDLTFPEDTRNDSLKQNIEDKISVFRGGISLTLGIPAGFRIKISGENLAKAELSENKNQSQISFSERNKKDGNFLCTAAYGLHKKGRAVWIGFDLSSIELHEDQVIFEKFLSNSINWLLHEPIAYVRNYPPGYNSAAVIAPVLSDSIKNIYKLLKILSAENLKASFFIEPETAIENLGLIANLDKYGETGVKLGTGEYSLSQSDSLRKAKKIIEQITGNKCRGCIYPPEINIEKILINVRSTGFDYLLSNRAAGVDPKYLLGNNKEKFVLFESSLSSSISADSAGINDFTPYKDYIDSLSYLNDIFVFAFLLNDDHQTKILSKVIHYLKEKNFYIATFSEIQERFYKMQNIEVNADHKGGKRIFLHISNSSETFVNEVPVDIDLNILSGMTRLSINPEFVSNRRIKMVDIDSRGILNLVFENLKPGISQNYFIDYDTGDI